MQYYNSVHNISDLQWYFLRSYLSIFFLQQAAAKGYFKYIEVLKYEEHLKKALKALQASEDLEKECMVLRKHKYLDDEGPISPIQESE